MIVVSGAAVNLNLLTFKKKYKKSGAFKTAYVD